MIKRNRNQPKPSTGEETQLASRQIRFMAQSVLLEEAGTSWMTSATIYVVGGVVASFIVWSSLTHVDEVAITHGSVVPAGSVQTVQHLEGGIVSEIMVKEKDLVKKGQPLIRMDPVQASGEADQIKARRIGLQLRAERLRAVAEARRTNFKSGPQYAHLVKDQMEIYNAQIDRWESQRLVFRKQAEQKRQEVAAVREQISATNRQISLLAKEVAMREKLAADGYTAQVVVYAVQRQHAAAESELGRLKGQEKTALEELKEMISREADLDQNVRENALNEMGTVTAELAQVEETLNRTNDRVNRLVITAPVSGYVQDLKVKTVGAVVPAGGVLMDIVPSDEKLNVETRIATRDIGFVKVGQPVTIKVTSYDFARYGSVAGMLTSVSATTINDEKTGQPFYKGVVELTQFHVGENAQANQIVPRMTVQADIVTGNKTFLQYLLKPIYVAMNGAFHER